MSMWFSSYWFFKSENEAIPDTDYPSNLFYYLLIFLFFFVSFHRKVYIDMAMMCKLLLELFGSN